LLELIQTLLDVEMLAPHGICLLWRPELIWTHAVADATIAAAYLSIPLALATFVRRRTDLEFGWMFVCFALFIMLCGLTHLFAIWTLWNPDYGAEALLKIVTGIVSVITGGLLWRLLPAAISLPSPAQLRRANEELAQRIRERDSALEALRRESAERQQAEALLRQAQKMEAIGQLTGGVAHDFNNLLSVILVSLERAERHAESDPGRVRDAIGSARLGATRAAELTHRLLAFARRQPLEPTVEDLNALVRELGGLLKRTLGTSTELRLELAPERCPARVDAQQTQNALLNLVVNGRDAMPGGGTVTIRTGTCRLEADEELPAGDYALIEVSDTGMGMQPEVAAAAFEPFFTTKPLGEGTGLGLSQVYGFIKQSNGRVILDTEPGRGTTVRILLPLAEEREELANA
jgi:signal transduction histidine kinase